MTLADRIKAARKRKNYTQKELADLLKVSSTTVAGWELGRNEPSIDTLKKLARVLDTSFNYLTGTTDNSGTNVNGNKPHEVDLEDKDVLFTYRGKPLSDEDRAIIERLMNGKADE